MKRRLVCCLLFALLLFGCEATAPGDTVTVGIQEGTGFFIPNNAQQVISGSDVEFELIFEKGYAFSSVDYQGEYEIEVRNGTDYLCLHDVRYPERLKLEVTSQYRTILYHANGGTAQSEARKETYDMTFHVRPNTSIGTDWLSRDGYTLVGWNTAPDGSGTAIGLGSRASVPETELLELYAQWAKWSDAADFSYTLEDGITITGYSGTDPVVVVPERIGGVDVTTIASGTFRGCRAEAVILPKSLVTVQTEAFSGCALRELTLFDNIEHIGSAAFLDCPELAALHINALEPPYGYDYRRESCLADKIDLLIEAQGQKKIVFYGGCSMWYNLDGARMQEGLGEQWRVINAGLNGAVNSAVQMQILMAYLESGDLFFHTPELSSGPQMLSEMGFGENDAKLWCGLEYNYDMVAQVDLREFPGLLDAFHQWLLMKQTGGGYDAHYEDGRGRPFFDPDFGGIPFPREVQEGQLLDDVFLDPDRIRQDSMERLEAYYRSMGDKGVRVYVSYACVNMDAVPQEQRENVELMDRLFREAIGGMQDAVLISRLSDYLYHNEDFFDTNYHLLSDAARRNTELWLRDLQAQMEADGLWEEEP